MNNNVRFSFSVCYTGDVQFVLSKTKFGDTKYNIWLSGGLRLLSVTCVLKVGSTQIMFQVVFRGFKVHAFMKSVLNHACRAQQ